MALSQTPVPVPAKTWTAGPEMIAATDYGFHNPGMFPVRTLILANPSTAPADDAQGYNEILAGQSDQYLGDGDVWFWCLVPVIVGVTLL